MLKITSILFGLLVAQGAPATVPGVDAPRPSAEPRRTTAVVFHVHGKAGVDCVRLSSGAGCVDRAHWAVAIGSDEYTLETIADGLKEAAKRDLLIRAEPTAPYGVVHPVIEAAKAAGCAPIAFAIGGLEPATPDEIRIALFWDPATKSVVRKLGTRVVKDAAELGFLLDNAQQDHVRAARAGVRVVIDAAPDVPWAEIVGVVDLCRGHGLTQVDFAAGTK